MLEEEQGALKSLFQRVRFLYGKQNKAEKRKYLCSSEYFLSSIYEKNQPRHLENQRVSAPHKYFTSLTMELLPWKVPAAILPFTGPAVGRCCCRSPFSELHSSYQLP